MFGIEEGLFWSGIEQGKMRLRYVAACMLEHALYRGTGCTIKIYKQTWSGHFTENIVLGSNLEMIVGLTFHRGDLFFTILHFNRLWLCFSPMIPGDA